MKNAFFASLHAVEERLQRVSRQLPYLPRALGLIWSAAPGLALLWAMLLLVQGFVPAASIALTRLLVNRAVLILQGGPYHGALPWGELAPALLLAAGIAALMLLGQLLQSLGSWLHTAQAEQVGLRVSSLILQKASQSDYSLFENPDSNDKLYRARLEATFRPVAVLDSLGLLAQGFVTLASMLALLLPYGPWLPLVLFASSLPLLWVVAHYRREQHAWQKSIAQQERRAWYYDWLLTSPESAAEMRLFGAAPGFLEAFQQIRLRLKADRLQLERSQLLGQLAAALIGLLAAGACMLVMAWRALQGAASLGDLVLFFQVLTQGQAVLRGLLQNAGQFYGSMLFLGNLFEFLDLEDRVVDAASPLPLPAPGGPVGLRFEGLTFAYPGSDRPVFSGFDLEIPAGQVTAIVGDNGAGKSTLLKLICRLYDPQAGRVTWNGADLREVPQGELRRQITVLFQEPVHYQASAGENIAFSQPGAADSAGVKRAAQEAGADGWISALPEGYDTRLGKWFEHGVDLSTGQWQRLALARAFYRRASLVLLDEPTSAMDAWSEAGWLRRLRDLSAGRTTVIITHRLTTAMQADRIYVLAEGKVVEWGDHASLLSRGGRYAEAWQAQTGQAPPERSAA